MDMKDSKESTKELFEFIRKNAEMGTVTLKKMSDILENADRSMADVITKQLTEYSRIFDAAGNKLRALGEEGENVSVFARTAANAMLSVQSIADKSPSHLAEMVIIGSIRGVISCLRQIRLNQNADSDAVNLAYRLLCAEQANIDELKRYL